MYFTCKWRTISNVLIKFKQYSTVFIDDLEVILLYTFKNDKILVCIKYKCLIFSLLEDRWCVTRREDKQVLAVILTDKRLRSFMLPRFSSYFKSTQFHNASMVLCHVKSIAYIYCLNVLLIYLYIYCYIHLHIYCLHLLFTSIIYIYCYIYLYIYCLHVLFTSIVNIYLYIYCLHLLLTAIVYICCFHLSLYVLFISIVYIYLYIYIVTSIVTSIQFSEIVFCSLS